MIGELLKTELNHFTQLALQGSPRQVLPAK